MAVTDACVLMAFSHQYQYNFLSKATDYFSHMPQQRWEEKKHRKESSPQPGIELTTNRSQVWLTQHSYPVGAFIWSC